MHACVCVCVFACVCVCVCFCVCVCVCVCVFVLELLKLARLVLNNICSSNTYTLHSFTHFDKLNLYIIMMLMIIETRII